jgi:hypothetical protein
MVVRCVYKKDPETACGDLDCLHKGTFHKISIIGDNCDRVSFLEEFKPKYNADGSFKSAAIQVRLGKAFPGLIQLDRHPKYGYKDRFYKIQ